MFNKVTRTVHPKFTKMKKKDVLEAIESTIEKYVKSSDPDINEAHNEFSLSLLSNSPNSCSFCKEFRMCADGQYGPNACEDCPNARTGDNLGSCKEWPSVINSEDHENEFINDDDEYDEDTQKLIDDEIGQRIEVLESWHSLVDVVWGNEISVDEARNLQAEAHKACGYEIEL